MPANRPIICFTPSRTWQVSVAKYRYPPAWESCTAQTNKGTSRRRARSAPCSVAAAPSTPGPRRSTRGLRALYHDVHGLAQPEGGYFRWIAGERRGEEQLLARGLLLLVEVGPHVWHIPQQVEERRGKRIRMTDAVGQ